MTPLTLRVYLEYTDSSRKQVKSIRALITSQEDAFFHYSHYFDAKLYRMLKPRHKITLPFQDYPAHFMRLVNSGMKRGKSAAASTTGMSMTVLKDGRAKFQLSAAGSRNGTIKLNFVRSSDEVRLCRCLKKAWSACASDLTLALCILLYHHLYLCLYLDIDLYLPTSIHPHLAPQVVREWVNESLRRAKSGGD